MRVSEQVGVGALRSSRVEGGDLRESAIETWSGKQFQSGTQRQREVQVWVGRVDEDSKDQGQRPPTATGKVLMSTARRTVRESTAWYYRDDLNASTRSMTMLQVDALC